MPDQSLEKRMNIVALAWPLFIEMLLRTALGTCDIFMLSGYSDKAVSAVGIINQITFFMVLISMMVSSGAGILISQNLGAGQKERASQVNVASVILGLAVGCGLSLLGFFGAKAVISVFALEKEVALYAYQYLIISSSLAINLTFGIILSTILRSFGLPNYSMRINLFAGVLNIIGNYIALYQPFGLPVYGVPGVAIATVFSQVVSTILFACMIKYKSIPMPMREWKRIGFPLYKKIMRIGLYNAGETLAYNFAQMMMIYFVAKFGTAALAAYTYAQTIARITFSFGVGVGQGSQILTGFYVGKQWFDDIFLKVQRYYLAAVSVSVVVAILMCLFRYPLINVFTQDAEIVPLFATLLIGSIFVEGGRAGNLVFISSLKGAGDIKFPVQFGIFSMWIIGVGSAYLLGFEMGYGVLGVWIAIGLDEWCRSLVMTYRWRTKVWTKFKLV